MRLEMAEFPVTEIRLGKAFRYHSGKLEVDRGQLKGLVLQDKRIEEGWLEVVVPGEKVRVTGIRDVVEPRVKVEGKGQVFPGILGSVAPVGEGRTHRLSGMAVVVAAEYEGTIRSGTAVERSAILDMWGPGAEASRFSSLVGLVLSLRLVKGLSELEAHTVIQRAELEVAKRLAEVTVGLKPKRVEIFDLSKKKPKLPRTILIQGYSTDSHHAHSGVSYYGMPVRESLATLVHPNELLDGAVGVNCTRGVCHHPTSWDWQNHPLVLGLYREHGERLNFAGVIFERIRFETHHGKEVIAHNTAQMGAALRADGALVTWVGGGNAFMDVMLTIQACEQKGIKTVLVGYESGVKGGVDAPLLYYVPEADAVVSTGNRNSPIELPEAERVVGAYENIQILNYPGAPVVRAQGPVTLDARDMIIGGVDIWGMQSWSCKDY
ncbi:MAG: hypothetical protein HYS67_07780 [Deltaproteobacteria bacterium]|nr:hypothetical protein [Deltaproteobacteria bacterium]